MTDKGAGFGTLINLLFTLLVAIIVPFVDKVEYLFYIGGGFSILVTNSFDKVLYSVDYFVSL
jgi:hypothetical protein